MTKNKENEKLVSILCYFLIGIIWYFVDEKMKKNEIVKFHSKQALNLIIISVGFNIILSIIPILFTLIGIIQLALFVIWIIALINAINDKKQEAYLVGGFAEKYLTY